MARCEHYMIRAGEAGMLAWQAVVERGGSYDEADAAYRQAWEAEASKTLR